MEPYAFPFHVTRVWVDHPEYLQGLPDGMGATPLEALEHALEVLAETSEDPRALAALEAIPHPLPRALAAAVLECRTPNVLDRQASHPRADDGAEMYWYVSLRWKEDTIQHAYADPAQRE